MVAGRTGHGFSDRLLYVSPLLPDVLWRLAGRASRGGTPARSAAGDAYAPHSAGAAGVAWRFSRVSAGARKCAPGARARLCCGRAPARRITPLRRWGRGVDAHLARRSDCRLAPGISGVRAGATDRGAVDPALAGTV